MASTRTARARLPTTRVLRRDQRSSTTPAHGPTRVKGSVSTAKARAMPPAVVARSGEKKNREASATSKPPSASWVVSRTASSRRNGTPPSRSRTTGYDAAAVVLGGGATDMLPSCHGAGRAPGP